MSNLTPFYSHGTHLSDNHIPHKPIKAIVSVMRLFNSSRPFGSAEVLNSVFYVTRKQKITYCEVRWTEGDQGQDVSSLAAQRPIHRCSVAYRWEICGLKGLRCLLKTRQTVVCGIAMSSLDASRTDFRGLFTKQLCRIRSTFSSEVLGWPDDFAQATGFLWKVSSNPLNC